MTRPSPLKGRENEVSDDESCRRLSDGNRSMICGRCRNRRRSDRLDARADRLQDCSILFLTASRLGATLFGIGVVAIGAGGSSRPSSAFSSRSEAPPPCDSLGDFCAPLCGPPPVSMVRQPPPCAGGPQPDDRLAGRARSLPRSLGIVVSRCLVIIASRIAGFESENVAPPAGLIGCWLGVVACLHVGR